MEVFEMHVPWLFSRHRVKFQMLLAKGTNMNKSSSHLLRRSLSHPNRLNLESHSHVVLRIA